MEFKELIEQRRSIRAYDAEKTLTKEELLQIIDEANQAPSWKNFQSTRYHYVLEGEALEKIKKEILPSFNQKNISGCQALLVTSYVKGQSGFLPDGKPACHLGNQWGAYDAGLHNAYFILSAANRGLGSLIIGLRYAEKIREIMAIPEEEEIVAVLALGYPAQEPAKPKRLAPEEISREWK